MKWRLGGRREAPPPVPETPAEVPSPSFDAEGGDRYAFSEAVVMLSPKPPRSALAIRNTAGELYERHIAQGRRAIAVCGARPGIGVSFVSVNLAVALSQMGVSTLLIDANLERPGLEAFIEPSRPTGGVRRFLGSPELTLGEVLHEEVLPHLSLIYSGGAGPDSQELLGHARMGELVRACLRDHPFTILDTPAADRTASARRVASLAGYALIVAKAGASHVENVRLLSRNLADDGVEVVGTVLNGA